MVTIIVVTIIKGITELTLASNLSLTKKQTSLPVCLAVCLRPEVGSGPAGERQSAFTSKSALRNSLFVCLLCVFVCLSVCYEAPLSIRVFACVCEVSVGECAL